jgi:hypothetical protein
MKCYTSTVAGLVRGIRVEGQPPCVVLGEVGRRSHQERVPFNEGSRPRVFSEDLHGVRLYRMMDADPVLVDGVWVLSASTGPDQRALVRLQTAATPAQYARGRWEVSEGSPVLIAQGTGTRGPVGKNGSWQDSLVVVSQGDVIVVQPEDSEPYIVSYTAEGLEQVA